MAKMKSSKLPVGERMKHIAKLWQKHKTEKPQVRGGDISETPVSETPKISKQQILAQELQDKEDEYQFKIKHSLYGQYATPFIKPTVMNDRGIPWILAQHPNKYSANPNQVLLYRNISQFLKSPFYKKYSDKLVEVAERSGYGVSSAKIIPGKDFRIVFRSRSTDDNNQYYLDCEDANEFMDVLDEAKESNVLVPIEFVSKKFMDLNKQLSGKQAEINSIIWKTGYDKSYSELEPIITQQKEDIEKLQQQLQEQQNSGGDWLSNIAEGAVGALKLLI
jgi:hypothetical protein